MADLALETALCAQYGYQLIAGVDEAGRGALAGPVVAAAVILPLAECEALREVNDSKQLTPQKRDYFYDLILERALAYGVGLVSAAEIDRQGIAPATRAAMVAALRRLQPSPQFLLIDGPIRLAAIPLPQQAVVGGDGLCLSIAAASVVAKVTRDRLMGSLHSDYPHYGFAVHKGYGTLQHRLALQHHGPCPEHRHSFAPIRQPLL